MERHGEPLKRRRALNLRQVSAAIRVSIMTRIAMLNIENDMSNRVSGPWNNRKLATISVRAGLREIASITSDLIDQKVLLNDDMERILEALEAKAEKIGGMSSDKRYMHAVNKIEKRWRTSMNGRKAHEKGALSGREADGMPEGHPV